MTYVGLIIPRHLFHLQSIKPPPEQYARHSHKRQSPLLSILSLFYCLFSFGLPKDFCWCLRGRANQASCGLDSQKHSVETGWSPALKAITSHQPQSLDSSPPHYTRVGPVIPQQKHRAKLHWCWTAVADLTSGERPVLLNSYRLNDAKLKAQGPSSRFWSSPGRGWAEHYSNEMSSRRTTHLLLNLSAWVCPRLLLQQLGGACAIWSFAGVCMSTLLYLPGKLFT